MTPTDRENYLECGDGTICEGASQGWDCCNEHGGRKRCPKNTPLMCVEKKCAGGTDRCCSTDCADAGGPRLCGTFTILFMSFYTNILFMLYFYQDQSYHIEMSACGWLIPNDDDNILLCGDGTSCDGTSMGWSCCNDHRGRARCPKNTPIMCSEKRCAGGTDYCCSTDCKDAGGPRVCDA